nr:unnamed protein product [Callosobruchus analis]
MDAPSLTKDLQNLEHRRRVAGLSLFYRFYHGWCSNTLKSCLTAPLTKQYSIDEPKEHNPRLIIMDARVEGLDSSEDIINSIALLNGLDDSRKSEIKVVTKLKRFNNH